MRIGASRMGLSFIRLYIRLYNYIINVIGDLGGAADALGATAVAIGGLHGTKLATRALTAHHSARPGLGAYE